MTLARLKDALLRTYVDVIRNHTLQMAASLAYYFVLSFFPALILLSAILAYLPVPALLNPDSSLMLRLLPIESMSLVRRILADVVSTNRRALLSFGILGTLWATSGGFAAAITGLNIAYEVKDHRPYWKTRLLAMGLAVTVGALMLVSLSLTVVGPRFGEWLSGRVAVSPLWVLLWPYIHWTMVLGLVTLGVEALYFFGPNVKQRFLATLPGALIAVAFWIGLSYVLGTYFRHFGEFNKTYGTLGAAIALMIWFYSVLLDGLCSAGGSGAERGTRESEQRRRARTEAEARALILRLVNLAALWFALA
jgi:membrane protein